MFERLSVASGGRWKAVLGAVALAAGGCRSLPPLPVQDWPGARGAIEVLAERARRVDGVSARCDITVDPPDAGAVTLDGAFAVTERPARFRLQAWKFDQRVLDLTANEDGVWLWADERAKDIDRFLPREGGATPWLGPLLTPLDAEAAEVVSEGALSGVMTARWPLSGLVEEASEAGGWLTLDIDRPTLTIREVRISDAEGEDVQRLTLDRYRLVDGVPWPGRLRATGRVEVSLRLQEIELNPSLPEAAFDPPADATRRR